MADKTKSANKGTEQKTTKIFQCKITQKEREMNQWFKKSERNVLCCILLLLLFSFVVSDYIVLHSAAAAAKWTNIT